MALAVDSSFTSSNNKRQNYSYTIIPILILFTSFILVFFLLSNQTNLHYFLSPSLYKDLISKTTPLHPSSAISFALARQSKPSKKVGNDSDIAHVPMSENVQNDEKKGDNDGKDGKDLIFGGKKVESDEKDLIFDGKKGGNESVNGEKKGNPEIVEGRKDESERIREEEERVIKSCNLYMGKWVKDDGERERNRYPIYKASSCPFVDEAFDCQRNGRPDSGYLNWRWQPNDCDLPRFNPTDFLARLRGKRLMLIGDSMNRNQFESMLCLLYEGLPDKSRMYEVHGYKITKGRGYYIFKFLDFNCTIEFVRSHFLVKEGTRRNGQGNSNPTLSIDRIDKSAGKWKRADILVFNTGHWWTHGKTSRGKNYFKEGNQVYPRFDSVEAYRRALQTWAQWVEKNVNPKRQLVFYRAYSSAHFRGGDWNSGGTCNGEKEPIPESIFHDNYPTKMKIVEDVINQMHVPVILLNVTRLTNFRKDGHPSIFGKVRTSGAKVSTRKQDCSHWCLPGVPDAWNELIYANLVYQQTAASKRFVGS